MAHPTITCPSCNQQFELTPEYLAEYAGQTTACGCGASLQIPAPTDGSASQLSYAAPTAASAKAPDSAWRDGRFLVIARGVRLPNRCAKCGMPLEQKFKPTTLVKMNPGSLSVWSYLARHFMSDRIRVRFGYCREDMPFIEASATKITFLIIALSIPVLIVAISLVEPRNLAVFWTLIGLTMAAIGAVVWYFFAQRPITIESLDYKHAWLAGFGEEYLKHFPPIEEVRERAARQTASRLDQLGGQ